MPRRECEGVIPPKQYGQLRGYPTRAGMVPGVVGKAVELDFSSIGITAQRDELCYHPRLRT
ncbi:MAG: hypothetical protein ACREXK_01240 [Gammaproteobacteria bacterium]